MNSEENWLRFNKKAKIAVCDVETFNLNLNWQVNRAWQVSCLKVEGETILEEVDCLIKWDDCKFKIGAGAAEATKFNQKHFDAHCIDPKTAFAKFWPVLKWADHIIMHNGLRFDVYLLKGYAEWMGEDWKFLVNKIIDTKSIAQGLKLNRPFNPASDDWMDYQITYSNSVVKGVKTNLTALGKEYGIPFDYENLHNAANDVKLNLLVFNKLKWLCEI
jgi:DNA polymerase III epsilon subunit-like protein